MMNRIDVEKAVTSRDEVFVFSKTYTFELKRVVSGRITYYDARLKNNKYLVENARDLSVFLDYLRESHTNYNSNNDMPFSEEVAEFDGMETDIYDFITESERLPLDENGEYDDDSDTSVGDLSVRMNANVEAGIDWDNL